MSEPIDQTLGELEAGRAGPFWQRSEECCRQTFVCDPIVATTVDVVAGEQVRSTPANAQERRGTSERPREPRTTPFRSKDTTA